MVAIAAGVGGAVGIAVIVVIIVLCRRYGLCARLRLALARRGGAAGVLSVGEGADKEKGPWPTIATDSNPYDQL